MGSSTKKHKKDRDGSKKHKHKSTTRSRSGTPEQYRDRERVVYREREREVREYEYSERERPEYREREREREKRHHHHHHKKHHKEKRHRRAVEETYEYEREKEREPEEYHSDSSDVIEVPLAPPAPAITSSQHQKHTQEKYQEKYQDKYQDKYLDKYQDKYLEKYHDKHQEKPKARSRSPSPIPENGAGDCLSIAETNKLRAKLGLKPLELDTGPINSKKDNRDDPKNKASESSSAETGDLNQYKDDYGEFYHKPADNLAEKKQADKLRDKLKTRKEKRKLEEKLHRIRALGESEEDEDSAVNWVQKSREKEKLHKEAERRAKMLEEMDREFGVSALVEQETRDTKREAYKGKDLRGLRVEHDLDQFNEGREVILTLKDKEVLAEDDDALINVNMIDDERYKKNVENSKLNPNFYGYNAFAEEQIDEYGQIVSRSILGKYDEEIQGNKKTSFKIGEDVQDERQQKRRLLEIKSKLAGKVLESLDDTNLKLASEYYSPEELTSFKKPKKKVKKIRQKLKADDLLAIANETAIASSSSKDLGSRRRQQKLQHNGIIVTDDTPEMPMMDYSNIKIDDDDDDLQFMLSKARRLKQKEALITKTLDIVLKPEVKSEPESDDEMGIRDANIVLDSTAEFCRTLGDIPTYGLSGNRDEEANELMDFEQEIEEHDIAPEEIESSVGVWSSVNPDMERDVSNHPIELSDVAILDEEPDVSSGVAGALRLAMSKGYLEKDENNRPSGSRMAHLQAKNYSIEDKTYGDDDKFGRRDRYHSGPTVDFKEKETFKPNVKLEYIDDNGRILNSKEAFRYLSHKFHGKGPGKNKIEKRLKKMEQDNLMMKMNSTDTPLGTLNMLQLKQKETQSPYIVLSGSKQTHANSSIIKQKMK